MAGTFAALRKTCSRLDPTQSMAPDVSLPAILRYAGAMDFDHPPDDPCATFLQWLADARATDLPNPNAMTLATIDPDGRPSARIMLLKGLDERGAVFFTNMLSRKGRALAANPRVTLLFHWDVLDRQVRIEGPVTPVSEAEADEYFATRPRPSQIGAWASRQSEPAQDRAELERAVADVEARYAPDKPVPRPPHWSGCRVAPDRWEFWQGHRYRLHDRIAYERGAAGAWRAQRLFP